MNKKIDYTKIGSLTKKQIKEIVNLVNLHKPRAFVISYNNVFLVKKRLDPSIKLVAAAGFPFPSIDTTLSFKDFFDEFDIVIPIEMYYKRQNTKAVADVIKDTRKQIGSKLLKVIIETSFMYKKQDQIKELARCIEESGGDVIKTNTGKFPIQCDNDAKNNLRKRIFTDLIVDVKIIKSVSNLPIKASGGVNKIEQCQELIDLGVSYIGTSSNCWIKEKEDKNV